jgi:hypothetical protein
MMLIGHRNDFMQVELGDRSSRDTRGCEVLQEEYPEILHHRLAYLFFLSAAN